jgi:hypothetical protein
VVAGMEAEMEVLVGGKLVLLNIGFGLTATLQTLIAVSNMFPAEETEDLLKKKKYIQSDQKDKAAE